MAKFLLDANILIGVFRGESSLSPEIEIEGTISSVDSIVDPTSRTIRVVGRIQKGPSGLEKIVSQPPAARKLPSREATSPSSPAFS